MKVRVIYFTFTGQFVSSLLEPSLSDLLSLGKHLTEKLKIPQGNHHYQTNRTTQKEKVNRLELL